MTEHTLRLDDNSRITFVPTKDGVAIQLFQPGFLKDGHGFLLRGTTHLTREHVQQLFAELLYGEARDRAGGYQEVGEQ
jgi:hypothetical protein